MDTMDENVFNALTEKTTVEKAADISGDITRANVIAIDPPPKALGKHWTEQLIDFFRDGFCACGEHIDRPTL